MWGRQPSTWTFSGACRHLLLGGSFRGEGLEASHGACLGGLTAVTDFHLLARDRTGKEMGVPAGMCAREKGWVSKRKKSLYFIVSPPLEFFLGNDLQGKALGFLC